MGRTHPEVAHTCTDESMRVSELEMNFYYKIELAIDEWWVKQGFPTWPYIGFFLSDHILNFYKTGIKLSKQIITNLKVGVKHANNVE